MDVLAAQPNNASARSLGEGDEGVLVWRFGDKANPKLLRVLEVPEEVRLLWDAQMSCGRHNDIFEIEGVGPLVILENYPELLKGRMWLHVIDNAAALS